MISLFAVLNPVVYFAAIYFGAKYYNYDIDGFLLRRSYDFIFTFGCIQIMVRNSDFYKTMMTKYKKTMTSFRSEIDIIINNKVVQSTKRENLLNSPPNLFDLIVFKCDNNDSSKMDNILFTSVPSEKDFDYKCCTYTFVQVVLTFFTNNLVNTYKINLRDEKDNYYIVKNCLNSVVLSYLLFKNHNISQDLQEVSYTLNIMDQNVISLVLHENDVVIFHEKDYEIISQANSSDE